ncbi:hypothetical protein FKM82_029110, partial [Ascaphus truei]
SKLVKMPSIPEEPEVQESEVEGLVMPDFLRPLPDLDVVESREVELECQVTGMPYPTITWYHNGQKIQSSEDRKMTQYKDIHRLVFPSVSHPHAGVYKSVISNKVGKAACYAHLYVAGKNQGVTPLVVTGDNKRCHATCLGQVTMHIQQTLGDIQVT